MRRVKHSLFVFALCAFASLACATTLGDYTGYEIRSEGLVLRTDSAALIVTPYTDQIVRISLRPQGDVALDTSVVVVLNPGVFDWNVVEGPTEILISGQRYSASFSREPLRATWQFDGRTIIHEDSGYVWNGEQRAYRMSMAALEHFYGAGERADGLDHRGRNLQGYNAPSYCYGDGAENLNIAIPFLLSSRNYGLYFENTFPHSIDLGSDGNDVLEYSTEGGELSFFLIGGDSKPDVLEAYTLLTGRQPLPPRWALGYLQSRFGYQSQTEATAMVNAFRSQQIPLDAIILDLYWFGWGQMGDLNWDPTHWPAPATMMSNLSAQGAKTILITEPYMLQSSSNFQTCYVSGYLTPNSAGVPVIMPDFWAGSAALLDVTRPAAANWFWSQYRNRVEEGVEGWWCDLGEPELHPQSMVHYAGSAAQVHNIYSLQWAKLLFEGYASDYPTRRVFNLIRSGYAGMQRYSTFPWSGDVQRSFSGMSAQVPVMLNMGLSGVSFIGSDLGGFDCGPLNPELYIRWMQMGAFSPTMRAHGVNEPTEPVNFDSTTRAIVTNAIRWRYRLLPYNYTLAWQNHLSGIPLVRPLSFEIESEAAATLDNAYLWGDVFLVAPITVDGARSRTVLLPEGRWLNFWSEEAFTGGQTVSVAAPLEYTPVLVRSGSIIPTAPLVQSTDDYDTDTLIIQCYPDPQVNEFEFAMYDDDGNTANAYEQGDYELVTFRGSWSGSAFAIDCERSYVGYAGAPESREMFAQLHRVISHDGRILVDGAVIHALPDSMSFADADSAVWYDPARAILNVHWPWNGGQTNVTIEGLQTLSSETRPVYAPSLFRLHDAYPNPFNATTTIGFDLTQSEEMTVKVFDLSGREVAILFDGRADAGTHEIQWNAEGRASGVYIVRMSSNRSTASKKIFLLK